jgi:hypothetical protein
MSDQPFLLEMILRNSSIVSNGPGNNRSLETITDAMNHPSSRKPTETIGANVLFLEEESIDIEITR